MEEGLRDGQKWRWPPAAAEGFPEGWGANDEDGAAEEKGRRRLDVEVEGRRAGRGGGGAAAPYAEVVVEGAPFRSRRGSAARCREVWRGCLPRGKRRARAGQPASVGFQTAGECGPAIIRVGFRPREKGQVHESFGLPN
jgi:hypothetical protein